MKHHPRRTLRVFLFCSSLVIGLPMFGGPAVPDGYTTGTPWQGGRGVRESTAAIMDRQKAQEGQVRPVLIHPRLKKQGVDLPLYLTSGTVGGGAQTVTGPTPTAGAPQALSVNFTGATLADTQAFPPDSMGAAGPSQFIVAVNGRVRSFNKTTGTADGVLNANTDVFFNSVMTPPASNNFTSDPRIRYDRLSGRWFITMIDVPGQTGTLPNRIMIAVSNGSIITAATVWTFFYFEQDLVGTTPNSDTGLFADYPTLGIDANALYIGVNIFGSRGLKSSFSNTTGFVVKKSSLLGGGPIVVTAFRQLIPKGNSGGPYTPQGVDNYDPAAAEGYFIAVNSRTYGQLVLRRISNPGGTPSISPNISIALPVSNGPVIDVPHLGNTGGTAGYLDGLDYRLLAAHLRNGNLWATENVGVDNTGAANTTPTRDGVRWYELQGIASGQTPSFVQSGTLYQPSASNTSDQRSYWMGSIMVSGQGHAAMGFSVAGAQEYANAGTAGRLANDPPGQIRAPVLYTASNGAYNPRDLSGNPINRWGDFSYTSLDPNDDMTMWTIQEFCNAPNSYGVQVVRLLAPPPATPFSCNPSSIAAGAGSVNVVLTGTSDGTTGFFDPGAGFSNRLAGAVSGSGVTVNSLVYSDPTHVTLNLSVSSGASAGGRTVTITNPDGQSAASASAILTILGGATNSPPVLAAISDKTLNELTTLTFTNTASDPDGDALTFSLEPGTPIGASIDPTTGVFSWTPTEAQGPSTNSITVRVTDNGSPPLSDTKTFTVFVNEVNSAPVLAPIGNRTIHQGTTLVITNTATDSDLPTNTLTFSLINTVPAGATIGPLSGVLDWTPGASFANTTNTLTVQVTDNGTPPLSDSNSFTVTVVSRPVIEWETLSNSIVTVGWSAIAGQGYSLQYAQNPGDSNWTDLSPEVFATGPLALTTNSVGAVGQRFYRVRVLP